jgi:hypothetical protein
MTSSGPPPRVTAAWSGGATTEERALWDGELVAPRRGRRPDTEVELLPKVLHCPVLLPDVPHADVVEGHV